MSIIDYTKQHWYIYDDFNVIGVSFGNAKERDAEKRKIDNIEIAIINLNEIMECKIESLEGEKYNVKSYNGKLQRHYDNARARALEKARLMCKIFNENKIRP